MPHPRQPFLHDLVCTLAAPTQAWSAYDGNIGCRGHAVGAQGVLHADVRVLSALELLLDGRPPEHIATFGGDRRSEFTSVFRDASSSGNPDDAIRVARVRTVSPGRLDESVEIWSAAPQTTTVELTLRVAYDLAPIEQIKTGTAGSPCAFRAHQEGQPLRWGADDVTVSLAAPGATVRVAADGLSAELTWLVGLGSDTSRSATWSITISDRSAVVVPATGPGLDVPSARAGVTGLEDLLAGSTPQGRDRRLLPWVKRSLEDLNGLRMATREHPGEAFFAAGAPWYLTLFGRDSLWTARLLLPVDLTPAIGALRILARLAGTRIDPESAEEPGKIMHELRRGEFAFGGTILPGLYYGTIDATPLWICLLHDLWRTGRADEVVGDLLDPMTAALEWLVSCGDADGDGFLEYVDRTGHGLVNQGWKDSGDSVRFADGSLADGPVALCEVQGYAYEAACAGAELLERYRRPGAARYRDWAERLAERFRAEFWCGEGDERYPALALDGRKRRVDSLTSNIGHLLGTGLLDAGEELLVARRLASPDLDSGLGLRTMSASDGGYNPLSYHCGSVWPHDTAIVIAGLQRAGLLDHAAGLIEGLLRASVAFEQRLPELWSGEGRPVPYPAACRPQAWSAAAAVVVARALQGTSNK